MSVSLLEVLNNAGYELNNYKDCEWIISVNDEWNEIYSQAEDRIENCSHETVDVETMDNTDEYDYESSTGNPNATYHRYEVERCVDCGAIRRLPGGEWEV